MNYAQKTFQPYCSQLQQQFLPDALKLTLSGIILKEIGSFDNFNPFAIYYGKKPHQHFLPFYLFLKDPQNSKPIRKDAMLF